MGLRAGDLRHPIAIEAQGSGLDDYGGETGAWVLLKRTRAQFMPGTGQERREAAQERASLTGTFRVRANSVTRAIVAKNRIRFDPAAPLPAGDVPAGWPAWDVTSVVPFGRDGIDITAVLTA